MKRLLLAIVGVLGLFALIWFGSSSQESSALMLDDPTQALHPADANESRGSELQETAVQQLTATGGERRAVLADEFDESSALWIQGRVHLPTGVPADEELWVFATDRRADAGVLGLDTVRRTEEPRRLSRAAVDSLGGFELPVPAGFEKVHLSVSGRYVYSERSQMVMTSNPGEVLLSASLGAWIVGQLQEAPAIAEQDQDASEQSGKTHASLSIDPDGIANMFDGSAWALRVAQATAGRFEFGAVPTKEPLRIVAASGQSAAATSDRIRLVPGERHELTLVAGVGGTLRGVVVDAAGEPFPGVDVYALDDANFLAGRTGRRVRETLTDEQGRFELLGVAPGAISVRGEFTQHLLASKRVELEAGELIDEIKLVLTRGRSIVGRVLSPDGTGQADVTVTATFDVGKVGGMEGIYAIRGNYQQVSSAEDGSFELSGLGRGPFTVDAKWLPVEVRELELTPGQSARQALTGRADHVPPGEEELLVRLVAPLAIVGRVKIEDGIELPRYQVRASRAGQSLVKDFGNEVVQAVFDHGEEQFELWGLRPGTWSVMVNAEGYAPSEKQLVSLPLANGSPELVFPLVLEATVSGQVLDPDGSPVAGAQVAVSSNTLQRMSRVFHALGEDTSITQSNGQFRLPGLGAGVMSLVAEAPGWANSAPVEIELAPGLPLEGITLQLRKSAVVTGEVYGSDGNPAVGDAIIVQIPGSLEMRQTSSDPTGLFRFEDLHPGKWQVVAMPNEDRIAAVLAEEGGGVGGLIAGVRMRTISLAEGDEQHVVLGEPLPDPVHVFGRVTIDGEGAAGVVVSFIAAAELQGSVRFESADSTGNYEVALPAAGSYLMLVQRMGEVMAETSLEFRVQVPEVERHELDVEIPLGRITGLVQGPNGDPLGAARISLVGMNSAGQSFWGGQFSEVQTDSNGNYEVDWLGAGSYRVTAGGQRYGGMFGEPAPWGRGEGRAVEVGAGEHVRGIDFRLRSGGGVEGVIRDEGGQPVAGVAVFAYDSSGNLVERLTFVSSDAAGNYAVEALAPGEYSFLARGDGNASVLSSAVTVKSGQMSDLDLQVFAGTLLEIEVLDSKGEPVEANVRVVDRDGVEVSGALSFGQMLQALQDGSAQMLRQVGPLAPGRYEASASVPGVGQAQRKVTLRGQASKRLVLRLK